MVSWLQRLLNFSEFYWASSVNRPCGQEKGRGVPEKTTFVHNGGGRVRGLSTWTKMFLVTRFLHVNSKKATRISKKKLYTLWESLIRTLLVLWESGLGSPRVYINELLVCPFEQLYDESWYFGNKHIFRD